jgi:polyvinyl alcohol dehydrogenase (cytochrome)
VDAQTGSSSGKRRWTIFRCAHHGLAVYNNGRLYVPMSSGEETGSGAANYECCKFRGSLSALDAKTGSIIWKTYTIPDPPKQYKTTADGRKMFGPAGASLWSAPIIDENANESISAAAIHTPESSFPPPMQSWPSISKPGACSGRTR